MRIAIKLLGAASLAAASLLLPQTASADTICREECVGPVCSQKCVDTSDRDDRQTIEERREERREMLENREDDRRDEPKVELRLPSGDVEVRR
jgi:hypothetical protein